MGWSGEADDSALVWHVQVLEVLQSLAEQIIGRLISPNDPLMTAGLDSLGIVELKNAITAQFGVVLPATVALDYPTLQVHVPPDNNAGSASDAHCIYSSRSKIWP